jgi:hypothetical protein
VSETIAKLEHMSDDLFDGCWQRLDRAAEHRKASTDLWNEYLAPHPYDYTVIDNQDGTYIVRVTQDTPIPAELGILIGEWLYNLRAALDNIIWATAAHVAGTIPPPKEHVLQYPIYDNEDAWTKNLYRLNSLADHHRQMLHQMQPYNSDVDANYLGWVNRLSRDDRHRRPNAMTSYIADLRPVVGLPPGTQATIQFGERIIDGGSADCVRLTVHNWTPDMVVKLNPRLGIDPEVLTWSTSPFWRRWNFTERLKMMEIFIAGEVAVYEYDCTGTSRKQDLLSGGYKAECDARGHGTAPVPAPRGDTEWTEPESGKPASAETMKEVGYPRGYEPDDQE